MICPSNPYVSVAPILGLGEVAAYLEQRTVPVVAVSPIVGGQAIKGPAAKMMAELGAETSALGIARHYGTSIDGIVIDDLDAAEVPAIRALGMAALAAPTVMRDEADSRALATETLDFAAGLG